MDSTDRDRVYADVFNQLGDALIVTDLNGEITDWNQGAERVFGYTRAEALGRRPSFLFLPEEQATLDERVLSALAKNGSWFEEITVVHKDGTLRFCEALVVPLLDENGVPYLTIGVNRDITKRRETEEELRLAGEILEHMGEAAHLVKRDDLTFVHVNRAFRTLFGYEQKEVLGQHVAILNADDGVDPREVADDIAAALESSGSWTGEIHCVDKNGRRFWTLTSITSFHHHRHGQVWLTVQNDITGVKEQEAQRRRLEKQLLRAQRLEALGTLAGGVAHDFNNVLQAIFVATESARARLDDASGIQEDLATVAQYAERGRDIVQRILSFAKAREPKLEPVDLRELVSQTIAMLRPLLPASVRIETKLGAEPFIVRGDESQLQQVLVNLCTNASFAMRESGGKLTIKVDAFEAGAQPEGVGDNGPRGTSLRLSVEDTGEGIPAELRSHIFDPFFTTKERGEGSGLGLAIVHSIVESHQGGINFESVPGKTRFDVVLPRANGKVIGARSVARQVPSAPARVLFVDDEDQLLPIFARALSDHGLLVETAGSGEAAVEMFREDPERFDVVVTDQRMPGMSGTDLSRELAAIHPECPVVVMTGLFAGNEIKRATTVRASLTKPFSADDLLQTLERVLAENRARSNVAAK